MLNGRKRVITALTGLALTAAVGFVPGSAQATPDIKDVQARVDTLYHQAEEAQEHYHDAAIELRDLRRDLSGLKADQARQDHRAETVRKQLSDAIVHQYRGDNLSAVGQVIVSEDPSSFLGELSTMSSYNDLQSQLFSRYTTEAKALDLRASATERRVSQIADLKQQMAKDKASVDHKLADAKELLGKLKASQREAYTTSRSSARMPTVAVSGRAAAAVAFARAQLGKAYVYGAAGPNAYDCSGLTMAAWAAAGVGLPHSSSAQYGSGPHIAASQLQPGDLVFYYSPISHVGIYIGGGMIIHAANPSTGVVTAGLYSMPYSGAVRPG